MWVRGDCRTLRANGCVDYRRNAPRDEASGIIGSDLHLISRKVVDIGSAGVLPGFLPKPSLLALRNIKV